jgi:hypothetical protein
VNEQLIVAPIDRRTIVYKRVIRLPEVLRRAEEMIPIPVIPRAPAASNPASTTTGGPASGGPGGRGGGGGSRGSGSGGSGSSTQGSGSGSPQLTPP